MKVCVVVPVCNEEQVLEANITKLCEFLATRLPRQWEVVIAENGSADRTPEIAHHLARQLENVRLLELCQKGRGRALKGAWLSSDAEILAYMDADLSADLEGLPTLLGSLIPAEDDLRRLPIPFGRYDVSIGSRLLDSRLTARCRKREVLSRGYNLLHRSLLGCSFRDAQCGFKAITRAAARHLLPLVEDNNWFFDTELLFLAHRFGYRIHEFPVRWQERRETHVRLLPTIAEDIRGLLRLRRHLRQRKPEPVYSRKLAVAGGKDEIASSVNSGE